MIKKLPLIVFFLCNHLLAAQVSESYQNTLMEMIRVSGTEDSFVASVEQIKNIFLFNGVGECVKQTTNKLINVSELMNGLYIVKVLTNKGSSTKKIMVSH